MTKMNKDCPRRATYTPPRVFGHHAPIAKSVWNYGPPGHMIENSSEIQKMTPRQSQAADVSEILGVNLLSVNGTMVNCVRLGWMKMAKDGSLVVTKKGIDRSQETKHAQELSTRVIKCVLHLEQKGVM